MKKLILCVSVLLAMIGLGANAQDLTGQWQGTLKADRDLRIILKVTKDDGKLAATMWSPDQGAQGFRASKVMLDGSTFSFSIDVIGGKYEGKAGADGKTITGTWTQGTKPLPLALTKATADTAWDIPVPKPPKLMAEDANPSFEVATIKPNVSGAHQLQQLTVNGRNFRIRNGSLLDLIGFAYNLQLKQIANAPDWADIDRYDIDGVPDKEGDPRPQQLETMMQKLLADRFGLKFHEEKRELPAFVLTVAKTGLKISPTQMNGPLPGFGMGPAASGLTMRAMNAKMDEFTGFLQMIVLDRPVVNETELPGRYDFNVTFTPDDSQFRGHPPKLPQPADAAAVDSAPNLFEALQEQAGLRLNAEKTAVRVLVIDHVDKPSAN